MGALLFIRLVWRVWFIGSLFLTGFGLSNFTFRKDHSFKEFGRNLLVAVLWPIMLLSPAGRSKISKTLKGAL